jgi:hypothetical protein
VTVAVGRAGGKQRSAFVTSSAVASLAQVNAAPGDRLADGNLETNGALAGPAGRKRGRRPGAL